MATNATWMHDSIYPLMIPLLVLAVLLYLPLTLALSLPVFFGLTSELRSLTSALDKDSAQQLLNLLKDYNLQHICHYDHHQGTNSTGTAIASPFNDFGIDDGDLLALSVPSIFRNITIYGDWNEAAKRIHALENCPAVGRYTRNLQFDVYIQEELQRPPKYLAQKLAGLLFGIQELETLVLVIPEYHTDEFEAKLVNLSFPHVKSLVVGPHGEFATNLCPNLQILSSNGWPFKDSFRDGYAYQSQATNLVRAAGHVSNLTRLEVDTYWDVERLTGTINLL